MCHVYDVFELGFFSGSRERHRPLNHLRIKRRAIEGAPNVLECVSDALNIAHIGNRYFSSLGPKVRTAPIFSVHHSANRITGFQQLSSDDAAPSRRQHQSR